MILGRSVLPTAPLEISTEVELYAREHGRHGTIEYIPAMNAWLIRLTLKADDARMELYQTGMLSNAPTEDVWLLEPNPDAGSYIREIKQGPYRALDIYQMGANGIRTFLERGNTFSGRGEVKSLEEAVKKAHEKDMAATEKMRSDQREDAIHHANDRKRHYFDTPLITAGIDLTKQGN